MWEPPIPVIAVLCSDIHLSHRPPAIRSNETDWYDAMACALVQLGAIAEEHDVPIICAGDLFDKWNSPPELINFAIDYLPRNMYTIPGQHDLPHHSYDDIRKSAYWTLVRADVVKHLGGTELIKLKSSEYTIRAWPFPWGAKILPIIRRIEKNLVNLAVIHSYIWRDAETAFTGAPKENRITKYATALKGYDAAVFGDNHRGFIDSCGTVNVMNCGSLMIRSQDSRRYGPPMVGLLYGDGSIESRYLNTIRDVYLEPEKLDISDQDNISEFLHHLDNLYREFVDFSTMLRTLSEQHGPQIRRIIAKALEE